MSFVPRREKVRKGFKSPNGLALLGNAVNASKADTEARKQKDEAGKLDPWYTPAGGQPDTAVYSKDPSGKVFKNNVRQVKKGAK